MAEEKRSLLLGISCVFLCTVLAISIILAGIFMGGNVVPTGEYVELWNTVNISIIAIWIVCTPLLIVVYMKISKSKPPKPTGQ